jgi:predicted nucleic acid-binding protein
VIVVDTSVWIDHLRVGERRLADLLETGRVLQHPWVTGELALGRLANRGEVIGLLGGLPAAPVAEPRELLDFVERYELMGRGIGWVDLQLLASARLAGGSLWTRDRRLAGAAEIVGVEFEGPAID